MRARLVARPMTLTAVLSAPLASRLLALLPLERAEFFEKPVQNVGGRLVDVAAASTGARQYRREFLHLRLNLLRERRQVVGPVLELILPDANKVCGRLPERLSAQVRGEFFLKSFPSVVGNPGLMQNKIQQALMQVGYSRTTVVQMNWSNFPHL